MKRTAGEVAQAVGARVLGVAQLNVDGIASLANAGPGDLVFVENAKHMPDALRCAASAILAGKFAEHLAAQKTLLIVENPRLAFARAARLFLESKRLPGIHDSAVVHESVRFGTDVSIDARVVVAENVAVGNRTWIGSGCVIGAGVVIGDDCEIYPNVTIYSGTRVGNRVMVHAGAVLGSDGFGFVRDPASGNYEKFPQIGGLEIEDEVEIGANSTIDRGALETTRVGRGTKIDNLVHIGHNVQIGENVVIAAQSGFSGSVRVARDVIVGGQVGVGDHAGIEEGVVLGAQCGVPSNKIVRGKGVVFWGTPARPIKEYLQSLAALGKLGKREPR